MASITQTVIARPDVEATAARMRNEFRDAIAPKAKKGFDDATLVVASKTLKEKMP